MKFHFNLHFTGEKTKVQTLKAKNQTPYHSEFKLHALGYHILQYARDEGILSCPLSAPIDSYGDKMR